MVTVKGKVMHVVRRHVQRPEFPLHLLSSLQIALDRLAVLESGIISTTCLMIQETSWHGRHLHLHWLAWRYLCGLGQSLVEGVRQCIFI